MSENKSFSLYQQQKAIKPLVEDIIPEYLDGDMKKNALDFVAWLRNNKMSPAWASANAWKVSYKSKSVCYLRLRFLDRKLNNYSWVIETFFSDRIKYCDLLKSEGLLEHLSNNVWHCHGCGREPPHNCGMRRNVTDLGKEVKGVCGNNYLKFFCDPDEATVNGVMKLIEFRRQEIKAGDPK